MTSPCARNFVFSDQNRKLRGAFCFLGRARRGTDRKGAATRARAKERAEWAKATRRPWRTAAGRHTETHDRRAHHHESSNHRFFLDVSRGSSTYLLFTSSLFFVVLAELYTLHGERPPAIRRDVVLIAVLHLVRQSGKTRRSLIFVWCFFLVRLLFFHCLSAGRHSDSTPDSRRVPLSVHDYRAFRTVQAALQTAIAVVSSHELVSCGTGGIGTV